ncbi:fimbrial protein [Serratia marcescens]|uniref:Fimbrial protein n=1 Tax=Serratia marcescens TaxID=615 RepID=A0A1Q4NUN5_SERMA|nr:fimbrial protein [Serratia marcescens]OKB64581.1 fimbrial protein [Serratia marcescens]
MQRMFRYINNHRHYWHDWCYMLVISGLVMMIPLAVCIMVLLLPAAMAADNWQVEGANGQLHVRGVLSESACRLDMASAYQAVNLGQTGTAQLASVGARGAPVSVHLQLKDCLRSAANNRDMRSGNLLWDAHQPALSVSFMAQADADNPHLVQVAGASGLALRITDAQGRDVRLGERGRPLALAMGQNTLSYTVTPERTRAPLRAGAFSAYVDFRLSYD